MVACQGGQAANGQSCYGQRANGMQISFHVGAHRTGSTSFQTYMRKSKHQLGALGVGFWGPVRLRRGFIDGIIPKPSMLRPAEHFKRAQGRIKLGLARSAARGISHVIVSEENMIGTMRHNFASSSLYPSAGERVARFVEAFGPIASISLSIRSLDSYWTSALTYSILKGFPVAGAQKIERLGTQLRNWQDVIADIAEAAPDVPIYVSPFERSVGQPDAVLSKMIGKPTPRPQETIWRNARPSISRLKTLPLSDTECSALDAASVADRWYPLAPDICDALRERYQDDIFWLRAGADGLATYHEGHSITQGGLQPPLGAMTRGQDYDEGYRLARPG